MDTAGTKGVDRTYFMGGENEEGEITTVSSSKKTVGERRTTNISNREGRKLGRYGGGNVKSN